MLCNRLLQNSKQQRSRSNPDIFVVKLLTFLLEKHHMSKRIKTTAWNWIFAMVSFLLFLARTRLMKLQFLSSNPLLVLVLVYSEESRRQSPLTHMLSQKSHRTGNLTIFLLQKNWLR